MIVQPTADAPLLVGLLVDVSGSMTSAIQNTSGGSLNRLQSFQAALGDLASKAQRLASTDAEDRLRLFAYGFGFGNPLSSIFGGSGPSVRDLLQGAQAGSSTIGISELAAKWAHYKNHVEGQAFHMFGSTPMLEGFRVVTERFRVEQNSRKLAGKILFMLSDGEPTDDPSGKVPAAAKELNDEEVLIVSCFVTDQDITSIRHLYGAPQSGWPAGANLMFNVASQLPQDSVFHSYLREHAWLVEPNARLFTQINQSQVLSEFLQMLVSPLQNKTSRVFVSYSHSDEHWLERLTVHLSPLVRNQSIDLWHDKRIVPGSRWKNEIDQALAEADAAVLLVSPDFLASEFIRQVELPALLERAQNRGAKILPVIVAPCRYDLSPLSPFQAMNSPDMPLSAMTKVKAETVLVDLSRQLA